MLTNLSIDYSAVVWMGWTKLQTQLLKASSALHVWSTFRVHRSFKTTGWSFIRPKSPPAELIAFLMITNLYQMILHRIVLLRCELFLFRQWGIQEKFWKWDSLSNGLVFHSRISEISLTPQSKRCKYWHFVIFI